MKAPLCESICVKSFARLLLESLGCAIFAAKLLGICSILQLAPVHCMVWCNISSLHGALPSDNILQQCKLTSAKCMIFARFGIMSENCALMFTALWNKKSAHCLETKNHHLHRMCNILAQNLVLRVVFAAFATITGKPLGTRSILKLTSVNWMLFLRLSEAQTYKWLAFAISWNYHLQIADNGMVFAACCG